MKPDDVGNCMDCAYYTGWRCYRYPPVITMAGPRRVEVDKTYWCGEYLARGKKRD